MIDSILQRHWAVWEDETNYQFFSDTEGKVLSTVQFGDGSYLPNFSLRKKSSIIRNNWKKSLIKDFEENIEIHQGQVIKQMYRYQYIREGKEMFRYDNFPRHPSVPSPYHHKHIAGRKNVEILSTAPILAEILKEIVSIISQGASVSSF